MSKVIISNVTKSFGDVVVLQKFDEVFEDKEFITLLGPSGCGKTTMLRMIAGFEKPTAGEISIGDRVVSSESVFVPPERRDIGMVFQSYAVWPHMTVFQNVAYPLTIQKLPKAEIRERVLKTLDIVHLSQYENRLPSQLSGGQQQRVALARALVAAPKILLLDEPLSNLDAKLRENMRFEIKEIQQTLGITVVYVTHDQTEAMAMSDRIIVINRGVVQQIGSPEEIYKNPVNQFVADFVGKVDFIRASADENSVTLSDGQTLPYTGDMRGEVTLAFRPENVHMTRSKPEGRPCLTCKLLSRFYLGDVYDCRVDMNGSTLRVITNTWDFEDVRPGEQVYLSVRDFHVFPGGDGDEQLRIVT